MSNKSSLALIILFTLLVLPRPTHAAAKTPYPSNIHVFDESPKFWIGLTAAGLGLFALDAPIRDFAGSRAIHSRVGDQIFNHGIVHLGEVYPYIIAFAGFASAGALSNDRHAYVVAAEIVGAPALSHLLAGAVKKGFGRLRPGQTNKPGMWFKGGDSFISGHSITAWTLATVLAKNFPRQDAEWLGCDDPAPVVPVICYTCATLVSIQRMYDKRHWSSDVYYGALAGYLSGSTAVWLGEKYLSRRLTVSLGNPVRVALNW